MCTKVNIFVKMLYATDDVDDMDIDEDRNSLGRLIGFTMLVQIY
jgi:hypothetical protein